MTTNTSFLYNTVIPPNSKAWAIGDREINDRDLFSDRSILLKIWRKLNDKWRVKLKIMSGNNKKLDVLYCYRKQLVPKFKVRKKIPTFNLKKNICMTNNDRWKDRRSWSCDRDRDHRSFFKWRLQFWWRSVWGSLSQFWRSGSCFASFKGFFTMSDLFLLKVVFVYSIEMFSKVN